MPDDTLLAQGLDGSRHGAAHVLKDFPVAAGVLGKNPGGAVDGFQGEDGGSAFFQRIGKIVKDLVCREGEDRGEVAHQKFYDVVHGRHGGAELHSVSGRAVDTILEHVDAEHGKVRDAVLMQEVVYLVEVVGLVAFLHAPVDFGCLAYGVAVERQEFVQGKEIFRLYAVNTAKAFNDRIDFDGVVLTKLDGDTRGGAALSIRAVVNKPIKYVGTGEKLEDIQEFNPEGMANRILGMGDIVELAKRAQEVYDLKEAERLQEKLKKNKFDFEDFMHQIAQIKKMGNLKDLASMIPGVGKAIKDIDIDDNAFKGIEAIINSMTPYERRNPDCIKGTRRQRIAKGSGTSLQDVNRLLKQFEETRKMMRMASGIKNPMKMMQQMKRGGMPGMGRR